ncbi:DNA-(apurinic or apyrimidinic site) endonuclease 2 [Diutina catenulata]
MDPVGRRDDASDTLRLVTFNVNGIKTLFNYHPWTELNQDLDALLQRLDGDVTSFQELKLTKETLAAVKDIGHLKNFRSFISLPQLRKGYSGVGVFVSNRVAVVAAEEGITGWLATGGATPWRERPDGIGGYTDIDRERGLVLDAEGRAVIVELAGNVVVISVYCPANSMATDEGEQFRMDFLRCLLLRCQKLHDAGKKVVLMGDINVSIDLIDHAETIAELASQNLVSALTPSFEKLNAEECAKFKSSRPQRRLLNDFVGPLFVDTTRVIQNRRLRMYTVWNTQKNYREINHGSRIDLILATPELEVVDANICPQVSGSDHCPVYCDFKWEYGSVPTTKIAFEAKTHFKIAKLNDIAAMFRQRRASPAVESDSTPPPSVVESAIKNDTTDQPKRKLVYTSRKTKPDPNDSNEPPAKRTKPTYTSRKPASKSITSFFK